MKIYNDILTPAEQIHYNIVVCRKGIVLVWRGVLGASRGLLQMATNRLSSE